MKTLLTITVLALALLAPAASQAAKGKKGGKGAARAVRAFDTNANSMIDGTEVDALRKAFESDKTGPLKDLDTDSDGKLSDSEIAAIKIKAKKKKN